MISKPRDESGNPIHDEWLKDYLKIGPRNVSTSNPYVKGKKTLEK